MFPSIKKYQFGSSESIDLQLLLDACKAGVPDYDEEMIRLAFNYCVIAHEGKLRKSGAKYYTHPLSVALIVIQEIPLDNESVVAAILHNVLDESDIYTYEDISFTFGTDVAKIIKGITRIKFVESQHIDRPDQSDNYRKLLLTLFTDIRIILIKLADKLDNMRTLQFVSSDSQVKIARETLDIYTPFANRLGLIRIKFELEDLSFKYLNPKAYKQIEDTIKGSHAERSEYVERFKEPIVELLDKEGLIKQENVGYKINGRAKSIYSIYNKTIIRRKNVEELYDIFAIRIILNTDNPLLCFYVYGIVANYYKPIPETFKDYISSPKENGYSSLHTAVAGHDGRIVEVQIRTEGMHHASEVGVAAHFRYKSGVNSNIFEDTLIQKWLDDVRDVFETIGNDNSSKILEIVSNTNLQSNIFVFTPNDEFRQLPSGATALDFAFDIHTDVGLSCISAKVNGKFCPINHRLNSGDKVEIITSKKKEPSIEWLNFVVTPKATTKLINYFKRQRQELINRGRELWSNKNDEFGFIFSEEEMATLIKNYHFNSENDFFEAVGKNSIYLDEEYSIILSNIISNLKFEVDFENKRIVKQINALQTISLKSIDPYINYEFDFEDCCNPIPGESILGVSNGSLNISVHSVQCEKCLKLQRTHPDNLLKLDWSMFENRIFCTKLRIMAADRKDLIRDIIAVIILDDAHIQMKSFNYDTTHASFSGEFGFQLTNKSDIFQIVNNIRQMPDVKKVDIIRK